MDKYRTRSEIEYDNVFDGIKYLSDEYFMKLAEESFNRGIHDSFIRFKDLEPNDQAEVIAMINYAHTMSIVGFMEEVERQKRDFNRD